MKLRIPYLWLSIILCCCTHALRAQGILFSENRIILQGKNIVSLQVCNPTELTRSYLLSFVDKRMNERGDIEPLTDSLPPANSLRSYLRIFPRAITLAPGECQEVQIQLKGMNTLADGEYRSYLYFLPRNPPEDEDTVVNEASVKFNIQFRVGAAIPIIYRKNTTLNGVEIDSVSLSLSDKEVDRTETAVLAFGLNRLGTQSVYGRLLVEGVREGAPVVLIDTPAKAIFTEIDRRRFKYYLPIKGLDVDASGRTLITISFTDAEIKGDPKPTRWVHHESLIVVPK